MGAESTERPPTSRQGLLPAWLRAEGPSALAACAISLLGAALTLQLWHADLHLPFVYSADGLQLQAAVKGMVANGWYEHNPDLGAPFGQTLLGFPAFAGDHLQVLALKAMSIGSSSPAVLINLYFLLGFPLVTLTAFVAMRGMGASRPASVVASAIYALAPYHFLRGENHLFVAGYFGVPLGLLLVMRSLGDEPLLARRANARGLLAWGSGRSLASVGICLLLGLTGVYYAVFTIMLLISVAAIWVLRRRASSAAAPVALAGVITVVLAANALPNTLYRYAHSDVAEVGHRFPAESEAYGLKLADLLLPVASHRIGPLADLNARYVSSTPVSEGHSGSLGAAASIGFLCICAALLARGAGLMRRRVGSRERRMAQAGLLALLLFVFGTVGGVATLFNYIVSPQLRATNRVSIMIAFLALLGVALLLDGMRDWLRTRGASSFVVPALLGAVLVLAVVDQTNDQMVPQYAQVKSQFYSDKSFVLSIEQQLPKGAAVFQLPYVPFPENPPVVRMEDYDLFRGYIHSSRLRWSYGPLKGSAGDWQAELAGLPTARWLKGVAAAGFSGIYIDRFGYVDSGARIERELRALTGGGPLVSPDGRLSFFSLLAYQRHLRATEPAAVLGALADATVRPAYIRFDSPFVETGISANGHARHGTGAREASVQVINPLRRPRTVEVTMTLLTSVPGSASVLFPDGGRVELANVTPAGVTVRRIVRLRPGASSLTLRTAVRPVWVGGLHIRLQLGDVLLQDTALTGPRAARL